MSKISCATDPSVGLSSADRKSFLDAIKSGVTPATAAEILLAEAKAERTDLLAYIDEQGIPTTKSARHTSKTAKSKTAKATAKADAKSDVAKLNQAFTNLYGKEWENAYKPSNVWSLSTDFSQAIQAAFGTDVVPVKATKRKFGGFNGIYLPSNKNTVYVNTDANVNFLAVTGHELLHDLKRDRPDLYEYLLDNAKNHFKDTSKYAARLDSLLQEGESLHTNAQIEEELVADFMGDAIADPEFLTKLAEDNPSKFKELLNSVIRWLNGVKNKLRDNVSQNYYNDIDGLRTHLRQVLNAYAEGKAIDKIKAPTSSTENSSGKVVFAGYNKGGESRKVGVKETADGQYDLFIDTPTEVKKVQAADTFRATHVQTKVGELKSGLSTVITNEEAAHVLAPIRKHSQETFMVLVTDERGKILNVIRHSKGSKDSSVVLPVEVIGAVSATKGAANIWFAHNHPSGIPTPSSSDHDITRALTEGMEGLDTISFNGHLIFGEGKSVTHFTELDGSVKTIDTHAAPRKKKVAVTERMIRKRNPSNAKSVTGSNVFDFVKAHDSESGVLLFDTQLRELGVISLSLKEMNSLRDGVQIPRILNAVNTTNASRVIPFSKAHKGNEAVRNVSNYLYRLQGLEVLDSVLTNSDGGMVSTAALGGTAGSKLAHFYSRKQTEPTGKEAHATAQKNATLPVSEGGLGLPKNNTAKDRAKAMGFDVDTVYYHGTDEDFTGFNTAKEGRTFGNIYLSSKPVIAETYLSAHGGRLMPLFVKKNNHLEIDGRGRNWNDLQNNDLIVNEFGDSEVGTIFNLSDEFERNDYTTTDEIGMYAKDKGYTGVTIKNIRDTGDNTHLYRHVENLKDEGIAVPMRGDGSYDFSNVSDEDMVKASSRSSLRIVVQDTTVLFDPKNIRSTNAAFDPMYKDESTLLASRKAPETGELFSRKETKGTNTSWKDARGFEDVDAATITSLGKIGTPPNQPLADRLGNKWDEAKERLSTKFRQKVLDQYDSIKSILGDKRSWMLMQMAGAAGGAVEMIITAGHGYLHKDGVIQIDTEKKGLAETLNPLGHEASRFLMWVAANRSNRINNDAKAADVKITKIEKDIKELEKYVSGGADGSVLNVDGSRWDAHELPDLNQARAELKSKKAELKSLEKTAAVRERLFEDTEIENLMALNKNNDSNPDREALYESVREDFEALHQSVVQIGVDSGLISKEDAAIWEGQGFYVPFYRISDEVGNEHGVSSVSGMVGQQAYKRLKGADMQLDDLLTNVIMNWEHIVSASLKNNAAKAALESAQAMSLARSVKEHNKSKDAVYVRENGKEAWYDLDDSEDGRLVLESLTSLNYQGLNSPSMEVLRKFKRLLTIGVTASPEFKIANLIRDSLQAVAVGDMDTNVLNNVIQGWQETTEGKESDIQAVAAGGLFGDSGYINGGDPDAIKMVMAKAIGQAEILDTEHKMKKWWNKYQDLGARLENVNRIANIDQNIKKGQDLLSANFAGRDHLDFQRSGASVAVRFLTQTIPFLNARMQGLDKLGRAFADPKQRKQAIAVIGTYAIASVLLYLYMKDDEDYQNAEQWERDTYHLIKLPDSDVMVRIPRPFEVGAIANLIERGVEQFADPSVGGEVFVERLQHMLSQTFALSVIPQALAPAMDIRANKSSFTGRNIESQSMQNVSSVNRRKPWSSQTGIGVSSVMDTVLPEGATLSPIQVDYLVKQYTGWMGSVTLQGIDLLARPMVGAPVRPSRQIQDYVAIGRFFRESKGRSSAQVTKFYDQRNQLNKDFANIQLYKANKEMDKYNAVMDRNKVLPAMRKAYNKAGFKLAKYNREIVNVTNNMSLSAEAKRDRINRLNIKRLRLAKDTVDRYKLN